MFGRRAACLYIKALLLGKLYFLGCREKYNVCPAKRGENGVPMNDIFAKSQRWDTAYFFCFCKKSTKKSSPKENVVFLWYPFLRRKSCDVRCLVSILCFLRHCCFADLLRRYKGRAPRSSRFSYIRV